MKQWIKESLLAAAMLGSVCVLASAMGLERVDRRIPVTKQTAPTAGQASQATQGEVKLLLDGAEKPMELEEYLTGVLLAEMPGTFHPEAKKAQAVAARTFALRVSGAGVKHGAGVVCGDPGCCQGYLSAQDYLSMGGSDTTVSQAKEAVQQTTGQVLIYDGALIDATYFSCSGGRTEAAVAVWGTEVPYLQAVESPGEENAAYYTDTVRFSSENFCSRLGVSLDGYPAQWFGAVTYTQGGGVDTITIGGKAYSGTQLRYALGLRSSSFVITGLTDSVVITTRGYGHRVGMSQYGADAMARGGSSYSQILAHYYRGSELVKQ